MLARKSIAENAKLHNFSLKEVENDFLDILESSVIQMHGASRSDKIKKRVTQEFRGH